MQLVVQEALERMLWLAGSYLVLVDAQDYHHVLAARGRRDDDLLGSAGQVPGRLGCVRKDAR